MRKFFKLALAAVTVLLLGSCSEINERIDKLESRINGIENETIKDISGQVNAISQSIADLGSIRSSIQSLTSTVGTQGGDIEDLKSADEALGGRIDELTDFVSGELANYAKSEWVKATFSTLEEYEKTCDTIAKIDERIGALDTRLSEKIASTADSLNSWINVQFGSYYTAAQMDAKLDALQAEIDSTDAENKAKADSIAAELTEAKAAVDSAKANIRAEYRAAIDTAITALDGKLSKALQDSILAVNNEIDHLTGWVKAIDNAVVALTGRVKALEDMIQSVSIIPYYSDGSVEVDDDGIFIDCIVSPASAVKGLKKDSVQLLITTVKTKAANVVTVSLDTDNNFKKDEANGTFSIKAKISENIPTEAGNTIAVAVKVQNGISKYTTNFVPVTIVPKGFRNLGIRSNGKPLYWATCNLGATKPQENGDYYAWGATELAYDQLSGNASFIFKSARPVSYGGYGWKGNEGDNTEKGFNNENAPYYNASGNATSQDDRYDKYTKEGSEDALEVLEASDDAATVSNSNLHTPTKEEFAALMAGCVCIWTDNYNSTGKPGLIVFRAKNESDKGKAKIGGSWKKWDESQSKFYTNCPDSQDYNSESPFDTHIFLPAAGFGASLNLTNYGSAGLYWSKNKPKEYTINANALIFNQTLGSIKNSHRYNGGSIRPVTSVGVPPTAN